MESTVFIREAKVLIDEIKTFQLAYLEPEEEIRKGQDLQRRINQMFSGLQNPTLPSAYKLRDAAMSAGFQINQIKLSWLAQFESIRS